MTRINFLTDRVAETSLSALSAGLGEPQKKPPYRKFPDGGFPKEDVYRWLYGGTEQPEDQIRDAVLATYADPFAGLPTMTTCTGRIAESPEKQEYRKASADYDFTISNHEIVTKEEAEQFSVNYEEIEKRMLRLYYDSILTT